MPPNEVGPRPGHHSHAEDTDTYTTISTHDSTGPGSWPQEAHADLGLVDDDKTPDMRQGGAMSRGLGRGAIGALQYALHGGAR